MTRKTLLPLVVAALAVGSSGTSTLADRQIATFKRPHAPISKRMSEIRAAKRKLAFQIDRSLRSKLHVMQWTIKASKDGRPILSGNHYRLVNLVSGRGIKKQKRIAGANLGWLKKNSGSFNVLIKRKSGNGQLRYGDVVALRLKSWGWFRYQKRKYGINFTTKKSPNFHFVIRGAANGKKIVAGMPIALHSIGARTEITYCKRSWGINLGHEGKSKCGGRFAGLATKLFGENGLLNTKDGLSGQGYKWAAGHLCEIGVGALAAGALSATGGSGAVVIGPASKLAIDECKKRA